jgi:S1-C subfamily serine protease
VVSGDAYVSVIVFDNTRDASELLRSFTPTIGQRWIHFASLGEGKASLAGLPAVTETFTGVNSQGVHTALQVQSVVRDGTGFVVVIGYPGEEAEKFRPQLAEIVRSFALSATAPQGKSDAPDLGVVTTDLSADETGSYGIQEPAGALVLQIRSDGPGERAGLKLHDLILGAGDEKVDSAASLEQILAGHRAGDKLALKLIRLGEDGKPVWLNPTVVLGAK